MAQNYKKIRIYAKKSAKNLRMSKKSSTFAVPFKKNGVISRSRAVVARQAHNLKVGGSIPPSATKKISYTLAYMRFFLYLCSQIQFNMAKYIIMAEEGEYGLIAQVKEKLGLDLADAEIIYTGVGAINIIRSLQNLDREAELYNIGYAGSANFDLGTWVEVTEARLNHPNVTYPEPTLEIQNSKFKIQNCRQAICYTNCDFVLASDYKDCVFDMELAFIAALGFKNLHSFKHVSDNLSLHAYHDLTHGVE